MTNRQNNSRCINGKTEVKIKTRYRQVQIALSVSIK